MIILKHSSDLDPRTIGQLYYLMSVRLDNGDRRFWKELVEVV